MIVMLCCPVALLLCCPECQGNSAAEHTCLGAGSLVPDWPGWCLFVIGPDVAISVRVGPRTYPDSH